MLIELRARHRARPVAWVFIGTLGLAVLASLASARTNGLHAAGQSSLTALVGGYHVAFLIAAVFAAVAAAVGTTCLRVDGRRVAGDGDEDLARTTVTEAA